MEHKTPIEKLSAAKLLRAIEVSDAHMSAIRVEMISAGRGHELSTQTYKLSDPLSLRFIEASIRTYVLIQESQRRREWHGSLRPIATVA